MSELCSGFVTTRAARELSNPPNFENHTFISHKSVKKSKNIDSTLNQSNNKIKETSSHDINKLRYEVIKFGAAGLQASPASSVALAISLGARPPKKKFKNYKDILNERQRCKSDAPKNTRALDKPKQHLYVIGKKVVPAKLKAKDGSYKNFLDNYGKATGPPQMGKGFKKGRNQKI